MCGTRRIVTDNGSKGQITLAGGRHSSAGADSHGVGVDQERDHHGHVERRLAAQLLGVILVEGREIDLRDEIQQEEHQVVFGSALAAQRLLAALLGVPRR